ncbi:putative membrane protein [Kushneria avicenniae]|uniref:Putative membrane protein n=1 Tax=Kushneria avicenniae TaxID=402385 RepID=A0A1I1JLV1_9GAMM|nr:carotenoid biosynthesis protein [Kushneria avicenniae]SFC48932.1 putative membrane protein [Kushneria avicenniae]
MTSRLPATRLRPTPVIVLLTLIYLAGVIGIALPLHDQFIRLTPLTLLASLGLVMAFHPGPSGPLRGYVALCYVVGFAAEAIGTSTGLLFGDYAYGHVLGPTLWHTPLIIGVNWALLLYCLNVVVQRVLPGLSRLLKGVVGAALMVALDVLIEPVAIHHEMWAWNATQVPLSNYIGWFIVSLPVSIYFHFLFARVYNPVATAVALLLAGFFAALTLLGV